MKTYLRHKILNVIDIKGLIAVEYLDFEGKYKEYVEEHNFWELCFVESGEVSLFIDRQEHKLLKNDIIFIPPDKKHLYRSTKGNESKVFVICFECYSNHITPIGKILFSLKENELECLKRIVYECKNTYYMNKDELLQVIPNPNFGGQQVITLQIEYLIICLLRMLATKDNPRVVFMNNEDFYDKLVDIIIDFFNENIEKKLTLKEICNKVNYSPAFISKTFKNKTGETLISYFNRIKIEEAKRLFDETDLSVAKVSSRLGFSEVKYFSSMFKKRVGIAPSIYIKEKERKQNGKIKGKTLELGTP